MLFWIIEVLLMHIYDALLMFIFMYHVFKHVANACINSFYRHVFRKTLLIPFCTRLQSTIRHLCVTDKPMHVLRSSTTRTYCVCLRFKVYRPRKKMSVSDLFFSFRVGR